MKIRLYVNREKMTSLWEFLADVWDRVKCAVKAFAAAPLCALGIHPVRVYTRVEKIEFIHILYYDCGLCGRPSLTVLQH